MAGSLSRRQKTEDRRQKFCRIHAMQQFEICRAAAQNSLSYVFCLLFSVICLLSSVLCYAEALPDPTQPPAGFAATAPASGVPAVEATAGKPVGLQSIIISEKRRAAIIDGKTVELGGKYGDARLIEVKEYSVVFQSAQGRQVINLFPGVKMETARIPVKMQADRKLKTKSSKMRPEGRKVNQAVVAGEK